MGVDNMYTRAIIFVCSIFVASSCSSGVDVESKKALDFVSKNILKATVLYSERISYCDNLTASNIPPKFDKKILNSLNATRENILTAVAFLKFNNYFICERDARLDLAFHLDTMEALKRSLQVDSNSVEELQSSISYPSIKDIELEMKYLKLSPSQRSYYESIFANKPFDLVKVLELNNLMR
jgi:hypothetical protein